jgi:hypothetical protein
MPFRFISRSIHTNLVDYPVAIVLMVSPFRLKLNNSSPVAPCLSVVTRVTARFEPAFADHATGLVRVIRYCLTLREDSAVDLISIAAPSTFHFAVLDGSYFWIVAAAVLLTKSVLSASKVSPTLQANLDTRPSR